MFSYPHKSKTALAINKGRFLVPLLFKAITISMYRLNRIDIQFFPYLVDPAGDTFEAGGKIIGHCILVKLLPGKSPAGGAKPDNIEY